VNKLAIYHIEFR